MNHHYGAIRPLTITDLIVFLTEGRNDIATAEYDALATEAKIVITRCTTGDLSSFAVCSQAAAHTTRRRVERLAQLGAPIPARISINFHPETATYTTPELDDIEQRFDHGERNP